MGECAEQEKENGSNDTAERRKSTSGSEARRECQAEKDLKWSVESNPYLKCAILNCFLKTSMLGYNYVKGQLYDVFFQIVIDVQDESFAVVQEKK